MRITEIESNTEWFKTLKIGAIFKYLEAFYIKTGLSANEPNAVDLMTGAEDIIRLDAEVYELDAEMIVKPKEEING